jgi:hypothetical protein
LIERTHIKVRKYSQLSNGRNEQLEALEHFKAERPQKITAFAGAGKTTNLELLARSR